jgi:hypothetical protein
VEVTTGRVTSAATHLSTEEIAQRLTETVGTSEHRRCRCHLSKEEEVIFLSPFLKNAESGEIATAGEIRLALEELLGHDVDYSTV